MKRERLVETFKTMVQIDSQSGEEGAMHEFLTDKFKQLGLTVKEDDSMLSTGLGANNLVATLAGTNTAKEPIFFSAHTDTVSPGNGIKVVERDGVLYSDGTTILGADDKAGIAIMLEAIETIIEEELPTGKVEFVLSPGEEIGLVGSSAMSMDLIESRVGYVLDNAGPVGSAIIASPTLYMYDVTITGKAAHAGLEPEKGVSAMAVLAQALPHIQTGRIDAETTANIGVISGGQATNVVMDEAVLKGEVRSISKDKADALIKEMTQAFETAAKDNGAEVAINVDLKATGYRMTDDLTVMKLFRRSVEALAIAPRTEVSGGGSDANVFNAKGKEVVNLSIGYEEIHTTSEYIPVSEMEKGVALVLRLIEHSPTKK
ncbi:M20/M25/M40 family metallo-hydrolase [Vagococcus acidifermentans]|uniref:Peptidase M20 dimerisation domain-containing protein n=1 Tax=Vagococcus acidifermentans TaxID=564710 RepID=A0A430AVK6_9ENTE|nr:M20/M25/M40 family metallo-hydrolase [Vagococcus acidifermentans]RSU12085.1 hypothetical protein CBF27_06575 [Vagococcus acidifermentans]